VAAATHRRGSILDDLTRRRHDTIRLGRLGTAAHAETLLGKHLTDRLLLD
jgi:hypothetical protein